MKPQLLIRTITIIVIVLLCAGIGVYSFWCLDREESLQDFNLYTLVPQDAVAVLETDYVERLIDDVEQLSCSKDGYYLYASEIFTYLKNHLHALLDDTPHGLSTQMNRALISFHAPDNPINQVLYCGLGTEDYDLVGAFWDECSLGPFPVKTFDYRRRKIYIYPMENGLFLSVFFTRHFMVAGFQKKLVEQVIDTYLDKNNSLLEQPEFELVYEDKQRRGSSAVLYANLNAVKMGAASDTSQVCARLGNWCGFDLQLDGDVIYCAGMYNDTDSLSNTYMNALRRQQALEGFPDAYLPTSTFYYHCWSASDKKAILRYADSLHYVPSFYGTNVEQWHKAYADFWLDYGGESMISAYFMSTDAADKRPCSVLISSLKNELSAERQLRSLLYAIPYDKIPGFSKSTVAGHKGQLVFASIENRNVVMMQGRIHFYEGHSMSEITYPIKVMKKLGVKTVIITNAAGAINKSFRPGDLMVITDHINMMGSNPLIGANDDTLGTRFPDMSEVYNKNLIKLADAAGRNLRIDLKHGIYIASSGPSYETPAEIKMARYIGADAAGMSTVPEAIVANYCGMKVLGISCISNYASGVSTKKLTHEEVIETTNAVKAKFKELLLLLLKNI